jgi:ankyrin repeat protein
VNHRDANLRWIALHWAAAVDVEIVRLLLDAGSDISAKGRDGATALHNAAIHGKDDCAKLLLERSRSTFSNQRIAEKYMKWLQHLPVLM